jgi:hypothetical protein
MLPRACLRACIATIDGRKAHKLVGAHSRVDLLFYDYALAL